jgi:hypothetical protein
MAGTIDEPGNPGGGTCRLSLRSRLIQALVDLLKAAICVSPAWAMWNSPDLVDKLIKAQSMGFFKCNWADKS